MNTDYLSPLQAAFESRRNEENALPMKAYMRNQFDFLGIQAPERAAMEKAFLKAHGLPPESEFEAIITRLWELPEREYAYFAMHLMEKWRKRATPGLVTLLEYTITTKSWWDTVDLIASRLVGSLFQAYPELIEPCTDRWMASGNMWLQRTCLLFQLKYKQTTNTELLFGFIERLSGSKEFFLQKAIGWALRELSKTDSGAVLAFVNSHELAPLSRREALKVLAKQRG